MNSSRTRKSITNLLFNIASQMLAVLISFVTRTVFIHVFSTRYLGINAVFADVLGLLSLADLGIGTAMSYSFYKPLAEGDQRQLAALTCFFQKLYRCVAAVVAAVGLMLIPFLPLIVKVDVDNSLLILYYLFSLTEITVSYLCCSRMAVLTADQNNYITASVGMAVSLLRMAAQLAAMLWFKSYIAYLAAAALGSLLNSVLVSKVAVKKYPFIRQKAALAHQEKQGIYRNMGAVFLYKVSSLLLNATDNILISVLVSTAAAGLYSNYLLIQSQLSRCFSLIFTSLTASIGNLIVKEGKQRRYEIFQCEQTVSFLICTVVVPCYVTLANDFISIWLGNDYLISMAAVCAAGTNLYLSCVLQPLWSYREATGLYTRTKWVMTVCAGLNIVLSLLLGVRFGIAGILLASSAARLATYVWYEPRLLFREYFGKSAGSYFRQMGHNAALTGGLTVCLGWFSQSFPSLSWTDWIIKALLCGIVCLAAAGALYGRSKELSPLWQKLKQHSRS